MGTALTRFRRRNLTQRSRGTRGYIFAHFSGSFRPRPSTRSLGILRLNAINHRNGGLVVHIICPCGPNCRGADHLGRAPDCFLSFEGTRLPFQWQNFDDLGELIVAGFVKRLFENIVQPQYEIYQCPSCGCEVIFVTIERSYGTSRTRVGDTARCPTKELLRYDR